MSKIRVGVLRGGPSPEYEVSLKTGQSILDSLPEDYFHKSDIFISKDGVWHTTGAPLSESEAVRRFDVLFNGLHGKYGEDGTLQSVLDSLNARYTGSGKLASALSMNKASAKRAFRMAGLKTPAYMAIIFEDGFLRVIRDGQEKSISMDDIGLLAKEIFLTFPQPAVVKPLSAGSSIGVHIVHGVEEILKAITEVITEHQSIILEEYIKGQEATCGVVDDFRGKDIYSLPPVEIIHSSKNNFFDYDAKYSGATQEICPGRFSRDVKSIIEDWARIAHHTLGLKDYSRSDFIITPKGSVYILEVNSLPGLTAESLLPKSINAVGSSLPEFSAHVAKRAFLRNK